MTGFLLGAALTALAAAAVAAWRAPQTALDAYDLGRSDGRDDGLVEGYRLGWEARTGAPLSPDELDRLDASLDAHIDHHIKEQS